jgi:small subunit ribosomal protein SAe
MWALGNIPTIVFCETDSPMKHVDIGIPSNKGKHSIGYMIWMLARMVMEMEGTIHPGNKWDIMVSACIFCGYNFIFNIK